MTNNYDFFISYSRADLEQVKSIKAELEQSTGAHCWMDLEGIESGSKFEEVIISAINSSETMLFMLSENSMKSDYAIKELDYAERKGKRLVIVVIKEVKMTDEFIFSYQKYDQISWNDESQREKLIRDICKWRNKLHCVKAKEEEANKNADEDDNALQLIPDKQNGKWGFIDKNTNIVVIHHQWKYVGGFSGELACVTNDYGKRGFIDKKGKVIIPCKWKNAGDFREGLARVQSNNNKWGYISNKGNIAIPCKWVEAKNFNEGLAQVKDRNKKWGFINKTGKEVIPFIWLSADDFNDELARVMNDDGKWGFIDKMGKTIVPCIWKCAWNFSKGLARVMDNSEKYGFINNTGSLVIPCKWKSLEYFQDGLARIMDENERYGFIDQMGKEIIPCSWKDADLFKNGKALVMDNDGNWNYIDKTGEVVDTL